MKKINILLITIFSLMLSMSVVAQEKSISGTVTSQSDGAPLPGVSVVVQGTTRGAQTDFDGKYSIQASVGEILNFSFIGMKTVSITVSSSDTIDVILEEDAASLDEVVVTALGIQKTRKSLTYAAQDINADELNRVKQTNPVNSLSGKVSGVVVNRSASGAGGSVKVTLRGNNSFGNNQPLYVVDGVPLSNPSASGPPSRDGTGVGNTGQPSDTFGDVNGGNKDGGDALSLINPDDIESLTVLKGASASALYGSAGLNGVILITTKKGKAGSFKVNVSSNVTVDAAAYFIDFNDATQNSVDDFLDTGITNINSVSLSGGTDKAQTYFSYSNSFASGIMPTNKLKQHTINFRETAQFFEDKLKVSGNVLASTQKINNKPVSGLYFNPLVGLYGFDSPGESLSDYANFEELDPTRNIMSQRWYRGTSDIEQNPYWILNRNPNESTNKKIVASLSLNFEVNDWLSIQTRGTYDQSLLNFESKIYATTEATLAPLTGRYIVNENDITQLYGDIIATINKDFSEEISFNAIIGGSITRNNTELFNADSGTNGGLQFANVFSFQNFNANASVSFNQSSLKNRTNSIFASTTIGFNDKIFVDLTARNDWTSTLPDGNNSFFYPSVGVTGVLSELFDLGENVSFAKLRASYAEVGNGFASDAIAPNRQILFGGGVSPTDPIRPFPGTIPEPERQRSFEIGTEWKFMDNRLGFDFGYYRTSTINQYFPFPTSAAIIGASSSGLNSGDIVNSGFEGTVYYIPVQNEDFKWTSTLNFAANDNEIKSIYDGTVADGLIEPSFFVVSGKGVNTFGSYLVEGGSFGDIYAQVARRDANGVPIVDGGALLRDEDDLVDGLKKVGNANPDFTLGWNNSFEYKNFTLDFLIDGKFGGETVSMTEGIIEGLSNNTSRETTNGTVNVVDLNGTPSTLTAQEFYGLAGGRNGFTGEYVYSATNVRLAEIALGYNFNLSEKSFFSSVRASLVGSNLFFFHKDAPHDPNIALSTGNALQGVDVLGLPSTRSTGLNIKLTF